MWYLLLWLLFWLATISILSVSYLFAYLIVLSSSNLENPFEVVTGSMYHVCYLIRTDMLTTIVPACTDTVESLFLYCNEVQNCCLFYGAVFLLFLTKQSRSLNHFHNILRLFDVLSNSTFTTSETILNYYL